MTGNVFIDTNIFLYAKFDDGKEKFKTANDLFRGIALLLPQPWNPIANYCIPKIYRTVRSSMER